MAKAPERETIDSLNRISDNLSAINKTLTESKKVETDKASANAEWVKRIQPLIEEVNRDCKKKWFTKRRKGQIASIFVPVLAIAIVIALVPILNNSAIISSAQLTAQLTPENATVTIGNETIPLREVNYYTYLLNQIPNGFNLMVATIAILISALAILVPLIFATSNQQDFAEEFFMQIAGKHPEYDKPYIKALINMKCREFYLNLPHLYHTNPELFEKEALLRRLYD